MNMEFPVELSPHSLQGTKVMSIIVL